jgi:YHS domain-containing protein
MKAHEGHGESTTMAAQTTCPVMGGEINKELYADHEGKRVYFCCGGCPEKFRKDPRMYLTKLEEMGQKPELIATTQTTCPVMGGEINKELYVDHEGRRVYFCCESCVGEFKKDPEKYLNKLEAIGQKPEML